MKDVLLCGQKRRKRIFITVLAIAAVFMAFLCIMVGSSGMSVVDCIRALFSDSDLQASRIMTGIRIPRMFAAVIAGAGLSVSGLVMQTSLNNPMAAPATLGVSNAAVFGANLSIIVFAGGYLSISNSFDGITLTAGYYSTSLIAFVFAVASVLIILGLCRIRSFSPGVVVLAGIALGAMWTAATSVLQFYATDVGLSAAVIWNFGDLGRATYSSDLIMFIVVMASLVVFMLLSWKFNALMSGDVAAASMGVNVSGLRFVALLLASLITAVCVSYLGVIGFVGIICPHIVKKIIGRDHRYSIPASAICGSILLLAADTLSRCIGNGASLPVGAITSLIGAPFFIALIFTRGKEHA